MKSKQLLCFLCLFCLTFSSPTHPSLAEEPQSEEYQVSFILCAPDGQMVENKQVSTFSHPLSVQSSSIMSDAPVIISGSYWLNDEEKPWEQIAGQAGILRVELVLVNQHQDENTQEKVPYFAQIQVPLDLRSSSLIEAPLADRVTVGYIQTISFSGLLHSTMLATWTAYSDHWSQDSVQITLVPKIITVPLPDIASQVSMQLQGLNNMDSGISKMLEGMRIMEKSINDLNMGFRDYQTGFRQWNIGFQELNSKLPEISKAFDEYLYHMSLIQEGVDQIQVALGEAETNFDKLQKDMEQTQQGVLLLGMTLTQLNTDHQEALTLSEDLIEQNASISLLANDILSEYPKDSDPWNLAKQVLTQTQSQQDLNLIIQGQSKKLTMINSIILEMQKKLKEEYLPLLSESHTAYQELIKGIDQIDDGILQMTDGLKQGREGSQEASKGAQELFEALTPLRQARIAIAEGIRALSQAPRMIISSLRQLRFQGIIPMNRANKEALDNFKRENMRLQMQKSIAEKYKNQALIIKIDFPPIPKQSENADFIKQQAQNLKPLNPLDRFKEWLRSLF